MKTHPSVRAAVAALCLLWVAAGQAAPPAPVVAVPFYTPGHFMQGLHRQWMQPAARTFAQRSLALTQGLRAWCEGPREVAPAEVRARWLSSVEAWERLSAVSIGPVVERRSPRAIDFAPTRPAQIERAIATAPKDAAAMERIGTSAKGLPALEWLLWTQPATPATPACAYAVQVATDVQREADALARDFDALAERAWDDENGVPAMAEALNQWLGGLQKLRWAQLEKPLRAAGAVDDRGAAVNDSAAAADPAGSAAGISAGVSAGTSAGIPAGIPNEIASDLSAGQTGREAPAFSRAASGSTAASWAAEWASLRAIGVLAHGAVPPPPGEGLVPLDTYLRGRGLGAPADALTRAVNGADAAMRGLAPGSVPRVLAASKSLDALARTVEAEVAPALQVSIGFSDADGD